MFERKSVLVLSNSGVNSVAIAIAKQREARLLVTSTIEGAIRFARNFSPAVAVVGGNFTSRMASIEAVLHEACPEMKITTAHAGALSNI
ncbi:MAG: hypothetical protein ACM3JB_17385 [Acidobacteriaceae bacterium]